MKLQRISIVVCGVIGFLAMAQAAWAGALQDLQPPKNDQPQVLSGEDWTDIRQLQEEHRHAVRSVGGSRVARNFEQALEATFDGRAFQVKPDGDAWLWGLRLRAFGRLGDEDTFDTLDVPKATHASGRKVTYVWGETLEEWFVNRRGGLEHGFTVHERPGACIEGSAAPAGSETLVLRMAVQGDLVPRLTSDLRGVRFGTIEGEPVLTYLGLVAFDANGRDLEAHFEVDGADLVLKVDGRDAEYPVTIDPVVQQAYLKASNTNPGDEFGYSVSVSGDTVAVGAPREDSDSRGVNGPQNNNNSSESGAVYVFVRDPTGWRQEAYIKSSNSDLADGFGWTVALSGDTLAVGTPFEDSSATGINGDPSNNAVRDSGAVYVLTRTSGNWTQEAYVKADVQRTNAAFGAGVALDGDTLVVGETLASVNGLTAAGITYVFERDALGWRQDAVLQASNPQSRALFGAAADVSGNRIVVGAPFENSEATGVNGIQNNTAAPQAGAAYVFEKSAGTWQQTAYLKASNTDAGDWFGAAVGISGDRVVAGAEFEASSARGVNGNQANNDFPNAGAAYVYVQEAGSWRFDSYLKPSNTSPVGVFGREVAIDGGVVVVTALGEDGASTGVNGNATGEGGVGASGAAYVYRVDDGVWKQTAYLKACDVDVTDTFGRSVAVSGETVVVGANWEDGSSTGVNGDPTTNNSGNSGAAYVFDLASPCGVSRYGDYQGANQLDLYSFDLPMAGASTEFEVSGLSGSGTLFVILSTVPSRTPFAGGTVLAHLGHNVFGPGVFIPIPVAGTSDEFSLSIPPGTEGFVAYAQGFLFDPFQPGGIAFTNGLEIRVCP